MDNPRKTSAPLIASLKVLNFVSTAFGKTSRVASATQTGLVRSYVVYFGLFLLLLIGLFIITPMVPQ